MKKPALFLIVILLTTDVMAQINVNPNPNGPVWITGDSKSVEDGYFDDIPLLHLSDTSLNTQLPLRVRNDTSMYFPPIFAQGDVCCCTFASEVGYIFTYEMNRIREVSAGLGWYLRQGVDTSDMHNLYHPLFGYNFKNDGNYKRFTYQADGFKLLQSVGCPMLNYYYDDCLQPNFSDSIKAMYWMSSYKGYADAIHQKVDSIYQIQFDADDFSSFDVLKHWLYDHNEGEGSIGGLASIAILTGGSHYERLPNDEYIYTQLGSTYGTGHVLTIVGYDDGICFDLDGDNHIEQNEYGAFRVANSWGPWPWQGTGFIWLPYTLMNDLQNGPVALCCTVKECDPTVFIKATWVHPHQYMRRNLFYFKLATRRQSNWDMDGAGMNYPIFRIQGGNNTLQGINEADTLALCFDYSAVFPNLDNAGKYFVKVYNTSNTINNKIKNLSLIDCRWNEVFELPCDSTKYSIDNSTTIIGIKYELLPFDQPIETSKTYNRDLVARRTVSISGNTTVTMNKPTVVNMYGTDLFDSEIIVDEDATLRLTDSVRIIAKRGDCRIIVRGSMTIGNGVVFEACDGATLELVFENDASFSASNVTFINCDLLLPSRSVSFYDCHFKGTPLAIYTNGELENADINAVVIRCDFVPNGHNYPKAVFIKDYPFYIVSDCSIDCTADSTFANGIYIKYSGSHNGSKNISGNTIKGCSEAGLLMFASRGDVTMNTIVGNRYGVKLMNDCNIGLFGGNCHALYADSTQYIHENAFNEVYMTGSSIPATFRYNAIIDSDDEPFVYHDAYVLSGENPPVRGNAIDVTYNYWGPSFVPSTHLYTTLVDGVFWHNPTWVLGDCDFDLTEAYNSLMSADSLNELGMYPAAKQAYQQVVTDYPSTVYAETALKTMLPLEYYAGNDYESLQDYYLTDAAIASDGTLSHLASSLANKCDEIMGNYPQAIAWYEEVLANPATGFNDSIFAAIDLGELYLKMEAGGEKGIGKMGQYKPESAIEHERQTEYALSLLPRRPIANKDCAENDPKLDISVPVCISISPNPTNGLIRIEGATIAEVKVYNTMGQLVMTTQNTNEIDLSGLAPGVYSLRIKDLHQTVTNKKVVVKQP